MGNRSMDWGSIQSKGVVPAVIVMKELNGNALDLLVCLYHL